MKSRPVQSLLCALMLSCSQTALLDAEPPVLAEMSAPTPATCQGDRPEIADPDDRPRPSTRAVDVGPQLPSGFVRLQDGFPTIIEEVRYAGSDNFMGRPVRGYGADHIVLTEAAALALRAVQADLLPQGYGLKAFDGYRPQRAVHDFVQWARDLPDNATKATYYPNVPKAELFRRGYIALESGHSRGSTVDVTLLKRTDEQRWKEVDMGTPFDFFGPESWSRSAAVSEVAMANRALLRTVMRRHGFKPYAQEWWHFTLEHEPFPETYFDFPIQ